MLHTADVHRALTVVGFAILTCAGPIVGKAAEAPAVIATIKPVHALVASVMHGVGTPKLLIAGGGSPHSYALKPSDAAALRGAKVVVRVSEQLEAFLEKPITALARDAVVVTLDQIEGMTILAPREGGVWEEHDHAEAHEHSHGERKDRAGTNGDHQHHEDINAHLWLDPLNAKVAVAHVAGALAKADPANAERYRANAKATEQRLDKLDKELATAARKIKGKRFVVFHDAYHYFENRYGLEAAGSITVSPERQPGARQLAQVREAIKQRRAICVFAEPQFEPKLVATLIAGTEARSGVLDPLGAALEPGPDLYFEVMRRLMRSLTQCLVEMSPNRKSDAK